MNENHCNVRVQKIQTQNKVCIDDLIFLSTIMHVAPRELQLAILKPFPPDGCIMHRAMAIALYGIPRTTVLYTVHIRVYTIYIMMCVCVRECLSSPPAGFLAKVY